MESEGVGNSSESRMKSAVGESPSGTDSSKANIQQTSRRLSGCPPDFKHPSQLSIMIRLANLRIWSCHCPELPR